MACSSRSTPVTRRAAGRRGQREVAEPAAEVEHLLARGRGRQGDGQLDERQVLPQVDLGEGLARWSTSASGPGPEGERLAGSSSPSRSLTPARRRGVPQGLRRRAGDGRGLAPRPAQEQAHRRAVPAGVDAHLAAARERARVPAAGFGQGAEHRVQGRVQHRAALERDHLVRAGAEEAEHRRAAAPGDVQPRAVAVAVARAARGASARPPAGRDGRCAAARPRRSSAWRPAAPGRPGAASRSRRRRRRPGRAGRRGRARA